MSAHLEQFCLHLLFIRLIPFIGFIALTGIIVLKKVLQKNVKNNSQ